jgi:hypothetical protein
MRIAILGLWTQVRRLWRPAITFVVVLASLSRCIEWTQPREADNSSIVRYISAVQTSAGDANAILRTGAPPADGSGPVVTAPIPEQILLGGTIQVTASASAVFNTVVVAVPGVNDYWELTLTAPTTSVQLLLVFSQDIPKELFDVRLGGASGGTFGTSQQSPISVISVGTGDVQINITWDSRADVDLHVVDPPGEEIYWGAKTSTSGGQLDLDSNAGCGSDGPRAENVFWASGLTPPPGAYVVRVDYWSNCAEVQTNYVVTVNVRGRPPQVFSGVFTGSGDAGNKGAGRLITTLTY